MKWLGPLVHLERGDHPGFVLCNAFLGGDFKKEVLYPYIHKCVIGAMSGGGEKWQDSIPVRTVTKNVLGLPIASLPFALAL